MNIKTLASVAALAAAPVTANAAVLLTVDLTTANQITITSTDGASASTVSGGDFIGFLLADFYNGGSASTEDSLVSGDLTHDGAGSDGSPDLIRLGSGTDNGLNVWSYSNDATVSFTTGERAFTGSATWNLSAASYAAMLAGNASGNIYFEADDAGDIPNASFIGEWERVAAVPLPASGLAIASALFGLGALGARKKKA